MFTCEGQIPQLVANVSVVTDGGSGGDGGVEDAVNLSLEVDAGGDQVGISRNTVYLDGTGSSDPDGTIVSYEWIKTGGESVDVTNVNDILFQKN